MHDVIHKQRIYSYLSTGDVDGSYNISGMCIEATYTASHSRANQVLVNININQGFCGGLQNLIKKAKTKKHL